MANINFKGNGPIDYAGIHNFLDSMDDDCRICDQYSRKLAGDLCEGCPFRSNSTYSGDKTGRIRVCPGAEFKQFGLINLPAMGKHMLFYFLDHPELDFTYPPLPDEDQLEHFTLERCIELGKNPKKHARTFLWHIHHENDLFYDDSEWNLLLCLNTEHVYFEMRNK